MQVYNFELKFEYEATQYRATCDIMHVYNYPHIRVNVILTKDISLVYIFYVIETNHKVWSPDEDSTPGSLRDKMGRKFLVFLSKLLTTKLRTEFSHLKFELPLYWESPGRYLKAGQTFIKDYRKRYQLYAYNDISQQHSEKTKVGSFETLDEMVSIAKGIDKEYIDMYDIEEGEYLRAELFGIYRQ